MSASAGDARREKILEALRSSDGPLSGGALAERCGVSRQVVVTDMALLRTRGEKIVSTNRGYVLLAGGAPARPRRLFKCRHTAEQTADELTCIVDLGGCVEDVFVNHRVYGKVSSELVISSRRDVERFMDELASGVVLDTDSPAVMGELLRLEPTAFVARTSPVLDREEAISDTIKGFAAEGYDLIILLGGSGGGHGTCLYRRLAARGIPVF